MAELLNCPFCGGEASDTGHQKWSRPVKDTTWNDGSPITEAYFVNCMTCGVNTRGALSLGHQTRAKAIAAWNRRTPAPDLARAYIAQAAELTRLRAMLTPPDDVPCYTVDALKYNDSIDLPGDMPMVPADLVTSLRARIEAADKLAGEAREARNNLLAAAQNIVGDAYALEYVADLDAALSAYEGAKG